MTKSLIESAAASNREAWNASAAHHKAGDGWKMRLASAHEGGFSCLDATITPLLLSIGVALALIPIGVLNWMPDLKACFCAASATLRQEGTLVIYETHPILDMFLPDSADPYRPAESYFRREPFMDDRAIVHESNATKNGSATYWFAHPLSDIVTAVLEPGLKLTISPNSRMAIARKPLQFTRVSPRSFRCATRSPRKSAKESHASRFLDEFLGAPFPEQLGATPRTPGRQSTQIDDAIGAEVAKGLPRFTPAYEYPDLLEIGERKRPYDPRSVVAKRVAIADMQSTLFANRPADGPDLLIPRGFQVGRTNQESRIVQ